MSSYSYKGVKKSLETYERAGQVIPGYTQLRSRLANGFAEGVSPIYADHAKGSRFVDIDGNEFIDWVNPSAPSSWATMTTLSTTPSRSRSTEVASTPSTVPRRSS